MRRAVRRRLRTCREAISFAKKDRFRSIYLLVELDFAVEVLLGDRGKVLDLLCVVRLHLGNRRVQNGLAPRRDFLVWLRGE